MSVLTKPLKVESVKGRGRPRCEDSRKRILEAAAELMEEVGFTNATTDEIAERANASKATIYRWWPTKAILLAEALRTAVGQESAFPYTGNFENDIRRQLRNFLALLNGPRGRVFRAFLSAVQNDAEVASAFLTQWVQPRRLEAKAVLERYRTQGIIRPGTDLDVLLDTMYGPFYFRLITNHGRLSTAFADAVAEAAVRGVLTSAC